MSKKYNVMIVADMPERIKQVKENILRGLIEANVINEVASSVGAFGEREFAKANDLAHRDKITTIVIVMGPNAEEAIVEGERNTKENNVQVFRYNTSAPIFPRLALDLLMFLSDDCDVTKF